MKIFEIPKGIPAIFRNSICTKILAILIKTVSLRLGKINLKTLVELIIIALLGFALKYYPGPARDLLNNSLAGIAYVIFWCLFFKLLFPKAKSLKIILIVTILTCLLEFAQLWHPPILNFIRSFWLGKIILGTTFNITDIPYYFAGGFIAWLLLRCNKENVM